MIPGRPVTRRASLSAPSIASEPELRNITESSGSGNVAASSVARSVIGSVKPSALIGPDQPVDLGVDRRRHARMAVAQRRDRDPVREVEVGLAVGVVQPVALAVAPRALEVAPEDGRQVRAGVEGHGRSGLLVGGVGRVYGARSGAPRAPAPPGILGSPASPRLAPVPGLDCEEPTMSKLRLGVIGAGAWAMAQHLPAFAARADEVEPVIVNRRDPDMLREVQERFGFERATTDWQEVIEAEPDLVVIASTASGHYAQTKAALQAGAHVLCEKPFVFKAEEAWDLVETAAANDRHLMIAYGYNHMPMTLEAKRLMETDGGIGDIEQTSIHMASHIRDLLRSGAPYLGDKPEQAPKHKSWGDPAASGGGYGQGQLTHTLALALWLTDLRAAEVFAFMYTPEDLPVEFHDALTVRYTNGGVGSVAGPRATSTSASRSRCARSATTDRSMSTSSASSSGASGPVATTSGSRSRPS